MIRAVLSLISFVVATIVGSVIAVVTPIFDRTGETVMAVARVWARIVLGAPGVKLNIELVGKLDPKRPYVFMANHASSLDIWAVFVAIPRRIRLIAKKQLARIPFFGWVMWAGRFIFIDRQNGVAARRSIEVAGQRIHDGDSVLLFPEGTRTRDGTLGPFKKGGFHLAVKAGVPIVPVALRGTRELMPRGSLLLRSGTMTAIIGEPIPTQGLSDEERANLSERVRGAVEAMLSGP